MSTTCAPQRTIKPPAFWTLCLLTAGLCLAHWLPAADGPAGRYIYLLAGTPTPDAASGFPVRLYAVAGARLAPVRQVAAGLFSVANDLSGHLYILNLGQTALSVIHEDAPDKADAVPPPPQPKGRVASFSFYYPTWGAIQGPGVPAGAVFANHTNHWTVTRAFADAVRGEPRVARGTWGLYRYFRYEGSPGGPRRQTTFPGGIIQSGRIMMPYTLGGDGYGDLGPVPSFLPAEAGLVAGYPDRPRGANIVADTSRFFAFNAPMPNSKLMPPRTVYLLSKGTGRWSVLKLPFYSLWPRLFGVWLATTVQEPNPEGRVSPGLEDERAHEVDVDTPAGVERELPRVRGMYPTNVYMPGKLLLQNLNDGRKITIDTGQQDSEVLDVRKDGLVLFRVNDEIFSAQIQGDKLSAPTLVVKGEDVPEVHWAFWSHAPAKPTTSAKPLAKQ